MPYGEVVKRFNLFPNNPKPGTEQPDYGNSSVNLEVAIPEGEYSLGAWVQNDPNKPHYGSINVKIQQKLPNPDQQAVTDNAPTNSRFNVNG